MFQHPLHNSFRSMTCFAQTNNFPIEMILAIQCLLYSSKFLNAVCEEIIFNNATIFKCSSYYYEIFRNGCFAFKI